ncbi:MAG: KamA family radical SAM protein [Spirochaetales bacterium]|nr:KamA family radical SAM protein [Spirochaetales bacterium]
MVRTLQELESFIELNERERLWFEAHGDKLPLLVSRYYLSLIDPSDSLDPIRRQVIPSIEELSSSVEEDKDPLAEVAHSVHPRLIHRYKNRVALLVSDTCATYCRHCFRRRFTATEEKQITPKEMEAIADYLKGEPEVKEILLTGGDPLTLNDSNLRKLLISLYSARSDLTVRLCTRIPVTYPQRVTSALVALLKEVRKGPIYLMTQFNHPRELTKESIEAVSLFIDNGFPALNQSVLLRGVNDSVDVLEELMNSLLFNRIKPYYLFQGDLVEGTKHLRVPLEEGLRLERELRQRLSGLAMPTYAVDLPGGGGKVVLTHNYLVGIEGEAAIFDSPQGGRVEYPSD